jgi:hypothetical protein
MSKLAEFTKDNLGGTTVSYFKSNDQAHRRQWSVAELLSGAALC